MQAVTLAGSSRIIEGEAHGVPDPAILPIRGSGWKFSGLPHIRLGRALS